MKHYSLRGMPMLRLLLAICIGIALSYQLPQWTILFLLLTSLLCCMTAFATKRLFHLYHGVLLHLLFIIAGWSLHHQAITKKENHYSKYSLQRQLIVKIIDAQPTSFGKKTMAEVKGYVDASEEVHVASGKLVLHFQADSTKRKLICKGAIILLPANLLQEPPGEINPGQFNYRAYLKYKGIFHIAWVAESKIILLKNEPTGWLDRSMESSKLFISNSIYKYLGTGTKAGITAALIYGDDDLIDKETMRDYASTGTLHVLAVSGMHVGIIFMLGSWLLKPLEKRRNLILWRNILLIILLWGYAIICGSSPSILRATLMFSLILFAQIFRTGSAPLNTICGSAFLLLIYQPCLLFDAGFLLSYAAVSGIILFHPFVNSWFHPSHKFGFQIWQIISVSIAAQAGTLPLGLYYFHQFPMMFIPANLFIIPISSLILYLSMALLAFSPVYQIALPIGNLIQCLIQFMNDLANGFSNLPGAVWEGFYLNFWDILMAYFILLTFFQFFITKSKLIFKWLLLGICLMLSVKGILQFQQTQRAELVIFSDKLGSHFWLTKGHQAVFYSDHFSTSQSTFLKSAIAINNITKLTQIPLDSGWHFIQYNKLKMIVTGLGKPTSQIPIADILIIRSNQTASDLPLDKFSKIVVANSCKKFIPPLSLPKSKLHFLSRSGAFQLTLNHE